MDFILASGLLDPATICATFCLISGDASRRPLCNPASQIPSSFQFSNPFRVFPPAGNNVTTMRPATPFHGGMLSSGLIASTPLITQCHSLLPDGVGSTGL